MARIEINKTYIPTLGAGTGYHYQRDTKEEKKKKSKLKGKNTNSSKIQRLHTPFPDEDKNISYIQEKREEKINLDPFPDEEAASDEANASFPDVGIPLLAVSTASLGAESPFPGAGSPIPGAESPFPGVAARSACGDGPTPFENPLNLNLLATFQDKLPGAKVLTVCRCRRGVF